MNRYDKMDDLEANIQRVRHEIKKDPTVLENLLYLFNNMPYLTIKMKDLPQSVLDNDLIISEFVSKRRLDEKEYKYIPAHLLSNGYFLIKALASNPDLYFFATEEIKPLLFERMMKINESHILKYASKEQLSDENWVLSMIHKHKTNFAFAPVSVREQESLYQKLIYFNPSIVEALPKHVLDNPQAVRRIINTNSDVFEYLPEKYRQDREFALHMVIKKTSLLAFVGKELKKDDSFFQTILNEYDSNKKTLNLGRQEFHISTVLCQLPEHFFTPDFCLKYTKEIADSFTDFSSSLRANLHVILAASQGSNFMDSHYLSKINQIEIRHALKTMKKQKGYDKEEMRQYLQSFILKTHLEHRIPEKSVGSRLKI